MENTLAASLFKILGLISSIVRYMASAFWVTCSFFACSSVIPVSSSITPASSVVVIKEIPPNISSSVG